MHVIATAGHVDHGKSTLVHALTGMEPDRWAEERRRGLTIDLGYAWTDLSDDATVAFVDVPGHERFVPNMLAGVGPAPAALFAVAADEGWMPQSTEHLAALDALGVRHAVLAITRADLADPSTAMADARQRLADTCLRDAEAVAVSAVTGAGLDELRGALHRLVRRLPAPRLTAPVRLWVDRSFTIHGSGTVVTGTLGTGTLRSGDTLELVGAGNIAGPVRVRSLQALGHSESQVSAVARVAVNLRGVSRDHVRRGGALITPERFVMTDTVDVRISGDPVAQLPTETMLHIGSAAVTVRVRPLGHDTARLRLSRPLPLHCGDRALLRDPGRHHIIGAATILDVVPPPLSRRGAATRRATVLAGLAGIPDEHAELRRRRLMTRQDLIRMGVTVHRTPVVGDWLADPQWWRLMARRLHDQVHRWHTNRPLAAGMPVETLRQALGLPDRTLVEALVEPPLTLTDGMVSGPDAGLPAPVRRGVDTLRAELAARPFQAPPAARLAELGLGAPELAAASRLGLVARLTDGVVVAADAPVEAARLLEKLPQPFTLSDARQALGTSRRVAVPLLELLDRQGITRRLADDRRMVAATEIHR